MAGTVHEPIDIWRPETIHQLNFYSGRVLHPNQILNSSFENLLLSLNKKKGIQESQSNRATAHHGIIWKILNRLSSRILYQTKITNYIPHRNNKWREDIWCQILEHWFLNLLGQDWIDSNRKLKSRDIRRVRMSSENRRSPGMLLVLTNSRHSTLNLF